MNATHTTVWGAASLALCVTLSLGCHTGQQSAGEARAAAEDPELAAPQDPVRPAAPDSAAASSTGVTPGTAVQDPVRQDPEQPLPAFLENAFPPTIPDAEWHRDAWLQNDCMRCHETGVGEAPMLVHDSLPDLAREVKCRTCHVFVPGSEPREVVSDDQRFAANAFPPMIPGSSYHRDAWLRADCLLCHENGIKDAPVIRHRNLPARLLESKCRTCHVQVRAIEHDESILRLFR